MQRRRPAWGLVHTQMAAVEPPVCRLVAAVYRQALQDAHRGDQAAREWLDVTAPDWREQVQARTKGQGQVEVATIQDQLSTLTADYEARRAALEALQADQAAQAAALATLEVAQAEQAAQAQARQAAQQAFNQAHAQAQDAAQEVNERAHSWQLRAKKVVETLESLRQERAALYGRLVAAGGALGQVYAAHRQAFADEQDRVAALEADVRRLVEGVTLHLNLPAKVRQELRYDALDLGAVSRAASSAAK